MVETDIMRRLLKGEGPLWLPLLSGSMAPDLLPDDELYIETEYDKLKTGDIAVFFSNGKFYSHRVLCRFSFGKRRYILEKGDANFTASLIRENKTLGIVTKYRRMGSEVDLTGAEDVSKARAKAFRSFLKLLKIRRWR